MAGGRSVDTLPRASTPRQGWLLFVSLFVMLNLPLIFTLNTGIDQYSFFTSRIVGHAPYPLVLSFLVSTILAALSSMVHHLLWKQQYLGIRGLPGPFNRAALVTGVPFFAAFLPSTLLTVNGAQGYPIAVAFLMFGGLSIATALKDPECGGLRPAESLVWIVVATTIILAFAAISIGILVLFYLDETPPYASSLLLGNKTIDWSLLGYDAADFRQRHRSALPVFTLAGMTYMIIVVGGVMLGAIWKAGRGHSKVPEAPAYTEGTAPAPVGGMLNLWEPELGETIPEEADVNGAGIVVGESKPTLEEVLLHVQSLLKSKGEFPSPDGPYVIVINGRSSRISEDHLLVLRDQTVLDWFKDNFDIYVNLRLTQAWVDHKISELGGETFAFCTLAAYATEPPGYEWEIPKLQDQMMVYRTSNEKAPTMGWIITSLCNLRIIERTSRGRSRIEPTMKVCLVSERSKYMTGRE